MRRVVLISIVFLAGLFHETNAQQTTTPAGFLKDGDYFYFREDYKEALYNYLKLTGTDYENANLDYRIGVCYLHLPGQEPRAIPFFEKAIRDINPKYKKRSPKETGAPEYALFYLGDAYRIANQLDKALEYYKQFLNLPDFDDKYNRTIVENAIKSCEKAKIIQDIPVQVEEQNIGKPVNTGGDNYFPVLSEDETVLIYMTELKFYDAIFMSHREGKNWTAPINITPQVGSDGDTYPTDISADKQTLYLVKGTGNDRDIYISKWKDGMWTRMEPLGQEINSPRAEAHASLSPDNKTLYFSSNRRGGFGKLDIYRSRRRADGTWGPAENLGETINTPFNEDAPYLAGDGRTLFFVSEGHYNMGGYDIFYAQKKNRGWAIPTNIGYPVNTTGDNDYYFPVRDGMTGYLSLIRDDSYGKKDIYRIEIIPNKKPETRVYEGPVNMHGQKADGKNPYEIIVRDKGTEQIILKIIYDPATQTFRYYSPSGNYLYDYKINKDNP